MAKQGSPTFIACYEKNAITKPVDKIAYSLYAFCRNSFLLLHVFILTSCIALNTGTEETNGQKVWPAPPDQARFVHQATIYTSADIELKNEEDRFREYLTGSSKQQYSFNRPLAIAVRKGRIFIIDSTIKAVHAFDLTRRRYFRFGYRFEGKLDQPVDIDVSSSGNVYVADRGRKGVVIYDNLGLFKQFIALNDHVSQLAAVNYNPVTNTLFVVDRGGLDSDFHRVLEIDLNGNIKNIIGKRGTSEGDFNLPLDLTIDRAGNLYVLDSGNFRVQVFSAHGEFQKSWGKVGRSLGQFAHPRSITIDKSDNLYISDTQFGNIQVFNGDGTLLMHIGRLSHIDKSSQYSLITMGVPTKT